MFFGPDGDLPNTLSLSDYQYKNTKTLQTSVVYSKSFLSHIDSADPEGQVCHLSKCKLLYSKVLISFVPDLLLTICSSAALKSSGVLTQETQSTLDGEDGSDALLTFPRTRLL